MADDRPILVGDEGQAERPDLAQAVDDLRLGPVAVLGQGERLLDQRRDLLLFAMTFGSNLHARLIALVVRQC